MAINTLFQNIADAIREKTGSAGSLTPAQMPGAIRAINTGGLTIDQIGTGTAASGSVINLTHPISDYDIIIFHVVKPGNFIEENIYIAASLSANTVIGNYDNASYIWYIVTDLSTLTWAFHGSGMDGIPITIYGLKWG